MRCSAPETKQAFSAEPAKRGWMLCSEGAWWVMTTVGPRCGPSNRGYLGFGGVTEVGELAVQGERHVVAARRVEAGDQCGHVDRWEVVPTARAGERLEADDSGSGELVEVLDRIRHEPAPERDVDTAVGTRRCCLGGHARGGGRRRV